MGESSLSHETRSLIHEIVEDRKAKEHRFNCDLAAMDIAIWSLFMTLTREDKDMAKAYMGKFLEQFENRDSYESIKRTLRRFDEY